MVDGIGSTGEPSLYVFWFIWKHIICSPYNRAIKRPGASNQNPTMTVILYLTLSQFHVKHSSYFTFISLRIKLIAHTRSLDCKVVQIKFIIIPDMFRFIYIQHACCKEARYGVRCGRYGRIIQSSI